MWERRRSIRRGKEDRWVLYKFEEGKRKRGLSRNARVKEVNARGKMFF